MNATKCSPRTLRRRPWAEVLPAGLPWLVFRRRLGADLVFGWVGRRWIVSLNRGPQPLAHDCLRSQSIWGQSGPNAHYVPLFDVVELNIHQRTSKLDGKTFADKVADIRTGDADGPRGRRPSGLYGISGSTLSWIRLPHNLRTHQASKKSNSWRQTTLRFLSLLCRGRKRDNCTPYAPRSILLAYA